LPIVVLTSIPSPPPEWSVYYVGSWIHSWLPAWPANLTLPIHLYALIILVGIIVAIVVTNHRLTRRGGEPWIIIDIALPTVALGIILARAWHVVTHIDDFFGPGKNTWNPLEPGAVWNIWDGGDAILGALVGGAIGVAIGARWTGLRFWSIVDALAPTLLLAQALGRLGNYFNNELYGLPTDLPWGLEIPKDNLAYPSGLPAGTLFHPTFLYELILSLIGFVVIMLIENQRRGGVWSRRPYWQWGKVLGLYLIWYGAERSWLENIRIDPSQTYFGIRSNVWGAIAAIILGILIIAIQSRRHAGIEPSVYRPGKQWTPETVESEDTYSDDADDDDAEGITATTTKAPATSGAPAS
jgi:prolipoprotein diacylglyceryl transferase